MIEKPLIQILPLGPVAAADLMIVATTLRARFGVDTEVLPPEPPPASAFRSTRGQYDADVVLELLFDRLPLHVARIVAITEVDLYAEGRNFVFGYAHMRDRVAVFSTLRLHEAYWGRPEDGPLYTSRLEKALAHELGHTYQVPHCPEPRCVMHQVEFLWQLDELRTTYCRRCDVRIHRMAARPIDGPETLFELAGSYMRRRRFARAASTYALAVEADPANASYHNDHGVALLAVGDRAGATIAFQRAMRLAPAAPHAYYNLGIVSRERGDARTADHFFAEALRREDDLAAATRYLGILHEDYFHDPARARRYYEQHADLGGSDPEVSARLARLVERLAPATPTLEEQLVFLEVGAESTAPV